MTNYAGGAVSLCAERVCTSNLQPSAHILQCVSGDGIELHVVVILKPRLRINTDPPHLCSIQYVAPNQLVKQLNKQIKEAVQRNKSNERTDSATVRQSY
jgi:hypothetical protein